MGKNWMTIWLVGQIEFVSIVDLICVKKRCVGFENYSFNKTTQFRGKGAKISVVKTRHATLLVKYHTCANSTPLQIHSICQGCPCIYV